MSTVEKATLISGYAKIDSATLVGLSVASARSQFAQGASIPTSARATVNSEVVEGDYLLQAGDVLVFDEPTGTKG